MADFVHEPSYIRARHNRRRPDRQDDPGSTSREAVAGYVPVPEPNYLGYVSTRYCRSTLLRVAYVLTESCHCPAH
jgi:hypothetical protein